MLTGITSTQNPERHSEGEVIGDKIDESSRGERSALTLADHKRNWPIRIPSGIPFRGTGAGT